MAFGTFPRNGYGTMQRNFHGAFTDLIERVGLAKVLRRYVATRSGLILTLNRVLPRNEASLCFDPSKAVSEQAFVSLLTLLNQHYHVVPLDELLANPRNSAGRAKVALTFDDGWEDTFRVAFPHLLAHQMPATLFVCTGLVGTNQVLPEERFARLWTQCAAHSRLDDLVSDLSHWGVEKRKNQSERPKKRYWSEEVRRIPLTARLLLLDHFEQRYQITPVGNRRFLSWPEIDVMMRTGLIQLGSHTSRHATLPAENDHSIRREIEDARRLLLARTGTDAAIMSYPNGMYNRRVLDIVRSMGIRWALAGDPGLVTPRSNHWYIPRVAVRTAIRGVRFSASQVSFYFLSSWLRSPITAEAKDPVPADPPKPYQKLSHPESSHPGRQTLLPATLHYGEMPVLERSAADPVRRPIPATSPIPAHHISQDRRMVLPPHVSIHAANQDRPMQRLR